jgi:hypothetical protein
LKTWWQSEQNQTTVPVKRATSITRNDPQAGQDGGSSGGSFGSASGTGEDYTAKLIYLLINVDYVVIRPRWLFRE